MPRLAYERLDAMLINAPVETLPLYALVALLRAHATGQPANSCIAASYQLAGALHHLGYQAELMVASVSVASINDAAAKLTEVGVWNREPHVHGPQDSLYDGHVVVWSQSFARLVDLTIGQDATLLRHAKREPRLSLPMVLPIPGPESEPATLRGSFLISYRLFPQWSHTLEPYWQHAERLARLDRAALGLAHDALGLLRKLEEAEPARRLPGGPARNLLDGGAKLPEFDPT